MSRKLNTSPAVIGINIGKNSFHIVGPESARCHRAAAEVVTLAKWRPDSPICRRVESGWRPASARIISRAVGNNARLMRRHSGPTPYTAGNKNNLTSHVYAAAWVSG